MEDPRYPLTPIQQGMVFNHLATARSGADLEQILIDFPSPLDVPLFTQTWQEVVSANAALRLRLHEDTANPSLIAVRDFRIPVLDVTDRVSGAGWEAWLAEDRAIGFDLVREVPMRLAHGPLDSGMRLVWSFHHILLDGRSFPDVLADVFDAYEAFQAGRTPEITARPDRRPFLDWLEAQDQEGSRAFWHDRLEGFSGTTTLVQVPQVAHRWGNAELVLANEESARLRQACEGLGVSQAVLMEAAWALLLARYTDHEDVCFGVVRAGRKGSPVVDTEAMLGVFINNVPLRLRLGGLNGRGLLEAVARFHREVRPHERMPLTEIQKTVPGLPSPPFDTQVVYDREGLQSAVHRLRPNLRDIRFTLLEQPPFAVTLYGYGDGSGDGHIQLRLCHRHDALTPEQGRRALDHVRQLMLQLSSRPESPLDALTLLTEADFQALEHFNATTSEVPFVDVTTAIEACIARHPERTALLANGRAMTYRELGQLSARLASGLAEQGIGPGAVVGIALDRSFELVATVLAVLRVGAAYLPLDPSYPADRLRHYVSDLGARFIITQDRYRHLFDGTEARLMDVTAIAAGEGQGLAPVAPNPHDLMYVIYTSGSTGVPNGVMIEHRSAVNFFAGMDRVIPPGDGGRWLAVTSLSFDISILELLWTLTRGFEVALHGARPIRDTAPRAGFSLFHFAHGTDTVSDNPYRLILEAARFADAAGFEAVWSPERHFHDFGAPYPNPSVIGAAIAATTKRVAIRAGSVVLPLHDPLRVAEEWALVDQLSGGGRIGLAMASGWQPNDFALAPENYARRKEGMYEGIDTLRALWRGEAITRRNGVGDEVQLRTYPRPRSPELPIWITAAGNPDTFAQAGRIGANLLTHMLGQSVEQVRSNIAIYRQARLESGFNAGHVTLMLHTFLGEDEAAVKALVRDPMKAYLASSASLVGQYADTWTAYRRGSGAQVSADDIARMDEETRDELYEFAFERFFETSSLLGAEDKCAALVDQLLEAGVNEIACLIDFGVDTDTVLAHLPYIQRLATRINGEAEQAGDIPDLVADLRTYRPSHLQCTPSQARMALLASEDPADFSSLRHFMVGGEALPQDLALDLHRRLPAGARLTNMYGPTETTIWSTTAEIPRDASQITIGTPIVNTRCHVLDGQGRPVPPGHTGELFIAGDGLARGYHQRPELNARRFVKREVVPGRGPERMYATGDLVRLVDGALHYVGRRDFQFKIRGYRIELGEIETVLRAMQGVQDAVLVVRDDSVGNKQMVAYVVRAAGASIDPPAMQAYLREHLPAFMVPGVFVMLDSLPQTPNGKVDRKALPDPFVSRDSASKPGPGDEPKPSAETLATASAGEQEDTPSGEMETTVREIWQRLLGRAYIGAEDNFFEVGGHSILAVKLQGELRKTLGRRVAITDIFRYPTIRQLAGRLDGRA